MEIIKFDNGNLEDNTIKIDRDGDISSIGTALLSGQYLDGNMEQFSLYIISAAY